MKKDIEQLILTFNEGWTKGHLKVVAALLHEEVIFVAPDLKTQISGKDACLKTIEEYNQNAQTKHFEVVRQHIHLWDDTAVVDLEYDVEYVLNETTYREKGKEFWTLNRGPDTWKIVWRAMVNNEVVE